MMDGDDGDLNRHNDHDRRMRLPMSARDLQTLLKFDTLYSWLNSGLGTMNDERSPSLCAPTG